MNLDYSLRNLKLPIYNPINAGYEKCEPCHAFGPTTRNNVLLHYIVSGKGVFERGEKRYELSKDMCFIIRPGEVTFYRADDNDPWHYIWIGFTSPEMPHFLSNDVIDASVAKEIFYEIEEKCALYNSEYGDGGIREAYLCGRISEIVARLHISDSEKALKNGEMEIIKNYIDTSFETDIKIGQLAERFHFDGSYLSRAFKKSFGMSPQRYLVEKRLSEAAKLMKNYSFSPTAAANAVGYSDIYLFSKMFKRRYGVSPREYSRLRADSL